MIDDVARLLLRTTSRLGQSLPAVSGLFGRRPELDIGGRVVFITGAARGLGAEIARQAHARGACGRLVGRTLGAAAGRSPTTWASGQLPSKPT